MQQIATRRKRGGFAKNLPWLIVGAEMGLLAVMVFVAALGVGALMFYSTDRILPGVSAFGVNLGNKTVDQAAEALRSAWLANDIAVRDGDRVWRIAPGELGLELNAAETAINAQRVGRGSDGFAEALSSLFGGHEATPAISVELAKARAGLENIASYVDIPAQNASFRIENGTVRPIEPMPGRVLDVEAVLSYLELPGAAGAAFHGGVLDLVMADVQPTITDASGLAAQAQSVLGQQFNLTAYDPYIDLTLNWQLDPNTMSMWLTTRLADDGITPVLTFDDAALTNYLQQAEASLGEGRTIDIDEGKAQIQSALAAGNLSTMLRVKSTPVQYTVQQGDTFMKISAQFGIPVLYLTEANPQVDPHALHAGDVVNIPSREMMLPLPLVPNKRIVIDIGDLRMYVYQNGQMIQNWPTSTGIDDSPTLPGIFQIRTHEVEAYASNWNLYMPHFMGVYEAAPGFMNGIHGLPTRDGYTLVWESSLGARRSSYGCIILGLEEAAWLFDWAEEGVVVEIRE